MDLTVLSIGTTGWPSAMISPDRHVYVEFRAPKDDSIDKAQWRATLGSLVRSLMQFRNLGVSGERAVTGLLGDLPESVVANDGLRSIAHGAKRSLETSTLGRERPPASHEGRLRGERVPDLPFSRHRWGTIPTYRGNYGPVSNVQFSVQDAVRMSATTAGQIWFALLEAYVSEQGNDAILQKTAFVEVRPDGSYTAHEEPTILENSGGGGPYDLVMRNLVVSARGDVIAELVNHPGNVLVSLEPSQHRSEQVATFEAPSPELAPVARDVDEEVLRYLHRFPEHVTEFPSDAFEKIVAEVLRSHGFSDVQMNVRNKFGEIDIVAFEGGKGDSRMGYIVECKRYRRDRMVTLREAHVLAMKRIHMAPLGIEKALLVTTSGFTGPTRELYDSAWGLELKAYEEVLEWLRKYKPLKRGYHV